MARLPGAPQYGRGRSCKLRPAVHAKRTCCRARPVREAEDCSRPVGPFRDKLAREPFNRCHYRIRVRGRRDRAWQSSTFIQ